MLRGKPSVVDEFPGRRLVSSVRPAPGLVSARVG